MTNEEAQREDIRATLEICWESIINGHQKDVVNDIMSEPTPKAAYLIGCLLVRLTTEEEYAHVDSIRKLLWNRF